MEILEADPVLSGRLSGAAFVDAAFGQPVWTGTGGFRPNDYLVGSAYKGQQIEVAVLFAFRINQPFLQELGKDGTAQFLFTVPSFHEGNAHHVLPVDVLELERNARSAQDAAEALPACRLGTISHGDLLAGQLYRFPVPDARSLQAGDIVWIGINGRNPLSDQNHNFLIGGDLITLPGSAPPMLVAGDKKALTDTVHGISFLNSLHRRLNAPQRPGMATEEPFKVSKWVNTVTSRSQIDRLGAIHRILLRELGKLPEAQRQIRNDLIGFHSSIKPLDESWTLRLPVNGVATALCLVPALTLEGNTLQPFAFPRRFVITATPLEESDPIVIADWTAQDFQPSTTAPVVFSFNWRHYDSVEFTIHRGAVRGNRHFFALEELLLYRPEDQQETVVEIRDGDAILAEPHWSPTALTDGHTSLGLARLGQQVERHDAVLSFPHVPSEPPVITLTLPDRRRFWSLELYPISDSDDPRLPSTTFPRHLTIRWSDHAGFRPVIQSVEASMQDQRPRVGHPVRLQFEPVTSRFVSVRFDELPTSQGVPVLGLAEIRVNGGHSLDDAETTLRGFPAGTDPTLFTDNYADGYRLSDPLPWIMSLIRREVINAELTSIELLRDQLQKAHQRSIGLLTIGIGGALALLFGGILQWQRRKAAVESYSVRRRIQQDLHDEISSSLGTISLITSHLLRTGLPPEHTQELADINLCAREATASLREVIWLTDKRILTLDTAFSYMKLRAEQMVRDCELVIDLPSRVPPLRIASAYKRNLFLLFTEAIQNCLKHAEATRIVIILRISGLDLTVRIADNGTGFDPDTAPEGIGLPSMRERARQLGGALRISSTPSVGTTVELNAKLTAGS